MNAWNDLEQIKSEFCIVRFSHSRFSIFLHDLWVCFINHAHHTWAAEWVSRLAYLNLYETFSLYKFLIKILKIFLKYFDALRNFSGPLLATGLRVLSTCNFENLAILVKFCYHYCASRGARHV